MHTGARPTKILVSFLAFFFLPKLKSQDGCGVACIFDLQYQQFRFPNEFLVWISVSSFGAGGEEEKK